MFILSYIWMCFVDNIVNLRTKTAKSIKHVHPNHFSHETETSSAFFISRPPNEANCGCWTMIDFFER